MNVRPPPMQDAVLIEALNNATSLELYQLSALIERLMTDPRRIVAIRKALHLGQVLVAIRKRPYTAVRLRFRCQAAMKLRLR
jgi:hypothetical protein